MSADLAHKKRVQAGLSLGGATLGLAALGTKGGAVATRSALKRVPRVASRLRLSPKGADKADKASIGLVTVASGVGGASGINFAALQRAEAKKEDRVSKSAFGVVHKSDEDGARKAFMDREKKMRALNVGKPIESHFTAAPQRHLKLVAPPAVPRRRPADYGGHDPEKRRQTRMKVEESAAAGGSAAAAALAVGHGRDAVMNIRATRASGRRTIALQRKSANNELAAWGQNAAGNKPAAASHAKRALSYAKAAERSKTKMTPIFRAGAKARTRQAVGATVLAAGLGATAGGIHHLRSKGQGRKYTDWWDG